VGNTRTVSVTKKYTLKSMTAHELMKNTSGQWYDIENDRIANVYENISFLKNQLSSTMFWKIIKEEKEILK
jgi:hypothetical protein